MKTDEQQADQVQTIYYTPLVGTHLRMVLHPNCKQVPQILAAIEEQRQLSMRRPNSINNRIVPWSDSYLSNTLAESFSHISKARQIDPIEAEVESIIALPLLAEYTRRGLHQKHGFEVLTHTLCNAMGQWKVLQLSEEFTITLANLLNATERSFPGTYTTDDFVMAVWAIGMRGMKLPSIYSTSDFPLTHPSENDPLYKSMLEYVVSPQSQKSLEFFHALALQQDLTGVLKDEDDRVL